MSNKGFTLVEFIVGTAVFALAATLTLQSFVAASNYWRKSTIKEEAVSELRLTLDLLTTELAFGSAFPTDCADGCNSFVFATQVRPDMPLKTVEYKLDDTGTTILRAELKRTGLCGAYPFQEKCFADLTSSRTDIGTLRFYVKNFVENRHPLITVALAGTLLPGTEYEEQFSVSTSATPRSGVVVGARPPSDISPPTVTITIPTADDTYTTADTSITLGGEAHDNAEVVAMEWFNAQTGDGGAATFVPGADVTWQVNAIPLRPGATNNITVLARDTEGNTGQDTIAIVSTQPLAAPEIYFANSDCYYPGDPYSTTGNPYTRVEWSRVEGATNYWVYRCEGSTCAEDDFAKIAESYDPFLYDQFQNYDTTYQYRVRARSAVSGELSEFSNIKSTQTPADCPPLPPPPPLPTPEPTPTPTPAPITDPTPDPVPEPTPPPEEPTPEPPGPIPPARGFELHAAPQIIEVRVNGSSRNTFLSSEARITVEPTGGFSDPVNLSVASVLPPIDDFTPVWTPGETIEPGRFEQGVKFRARVRGDTPPIEDGTYRIMLAGQGGGASDTVTVFLRVRATEGFEE